MACASSPLASPSKKKMEHHDNLFAPDDDNFSDSSENENIEMENLTKKVGSVSIDSIQIYKYLIYCTELFSEPDQ